MIKVLWAYEPIFLVKQDTSIHAVLSTLVYQEKHPLLFPLVQFNRTVSTFLQILCKISSTRELGERVKMVQNIGFEGLNKQTL